MTVSATPNLPCITCMGASSSAGILLAAGHPDVHMVGFSTVHGNTVSMDCLVLIKPVIKGHYS